MKIIKLLEKIIFKIVILKEFVISNKVITFIKVQSNI